MSLRTQARLLDHVSSDNPIYAAIAELASNPVLSVIDSLFADQDARNQVVFDMADRLRAGDAERRPAVIPSSQRRRIYARDGLRCQYCDRACIRDVQHQPRAGNAATIDHRTPKCRGGSSGDENLSVACWDCNRNKGELTAEEFMAERTPATIAKGEGR